MSDNWILIIPERPDYLPDQARQKDALDYFRKIAPRADEVEVRDHGQIMFIDCGGNFDRVACPSCEAELDLDVWKSWLDKDSDGEAFRLTDHKTPCCGKVCTLNDLKYEWPQGFACFELSAMNPHIGKLSEEQCKQFVLLLGQAVRVIYRHL